MKYGLLRVPVGEQVVLKCPHRLSHDLLRNAGDIGNHAVFVNDTGSVVVHLLLIVGYSPVKRHAPVDLSHHVIPPPFSF